MEGKTMLPKKNKVNQAEKDAATLTTSSTDQKKKSFHLSQPLKQNKKQGETEDKEVKVKAKLRFLRMSAKKVRLVTDAIKGLPAVVAQNRLKLFNRTASRPVLKLLDSAVANAQNNFNLKKEGLFIKEIRVDEGSTLRRWQPRAHGRATPIRKRSTHINLVLSTREAVGEIKRQKTPLAAPIAMKDYFQAAESIKTAKSGEQPAVVPSTEEKTAAPFDKSRLGKRREFVQDDSRRQKKTKSILRKLFSRKAI